MAVFGRRKSDEIHLTPDVSHIRNPDVAYEHSDVPVTPVLKFVGGLVVFFIVVCIAMFLMFKVLESRAEKNELEASPLARQGDERLPPEPRLQIAPGWTAELENGERVVLSAARSPRPDPNAEYRVVREDWDKQLHNWGFVDQNAGTVHMPIEQAKQMYLQRQAQKQSQPSSGAAAKEMTGGAGTPVSEGMPEGSSSGRTNEKRNQ
ncbi:MAG: hypothetical protein WCD76_14535 [Pyrinomonadaceae bacterium]